MTQYRITLEYAETLGQPVKSALIREVLADTVGLACVKASAGAERPTRLGAEALLKSKGRDTWVVCYVSQAILAVLW